MDPAIVIAAAHAAMQAGRLDDARGLLVRLLAVRPDTAQAQHLLALVERRRGDQAAAACAFAHALRLTPADPQLHNNHGNFLLARGDATGAEAAYARAIRLAPGMADARLNLGLALLAQERAANAIEPLRHAVRLKPDLARAWSALGRALRLADRHDEAGPALDRALALDPAAAPALAARALLAAERGDRDAYVRTRAARRAAPADRALLLHETALRIAAGDPAPLDALADAVAADPDWLEGQRALARARFEAGEGPAAFRTLEAAVAQAPANADRRIALLALEGACRPAAEMLARADAARAAAGDHPMLDIARAEFALRAGEPAMALPLLDAAERGPPDDPALALVRARVAARVAIAAAMPDRADRLLETLMEARPATHADMELWALRETAWRLLGAPRHAWLAGHDRLWDRHALGLDASDLTDIVDLLRHLHERRRAHPLDQSLRGGTQTQGNLLLRADPPVRRLKAALADAVARHVAALPAPVAGHPTLDAEAGARAWRFAGSWSVRLTDAGFHVAHIHPAGWLSSACYLALPAMAGHEGHLALGEPPPELATSLPPLAMVQPGVGILALFPSWLWHATRPFARGERLTVAFDIALR